MFITKLKENFPKSLVQWNLFFKTSIPIIGAAMIFAFNGVIDNFMSVSIEGGLDALSYANTWTTLVSGIISTTTLVGAALFGQYYGAKDNINTTYVLRFRMLFACSIAFLFALPAFINPIGMLNFISGNFTTHEIDPSGVVFQEGSIYLSLIAITWISSAWGFTSAMIMREAGHGNASLISSIISISVNVILNSIFIYGLHLPLYFLSISTIVSQFFSVGFNIMYVFFKNKKLIVNPLKIFNISKSIYKQVWSRMSSFLFLSLSSIAVSLRFLFWNIAYPTKSIGDPSYLLSAATFLGIANAIFNVFWTTFESINSNITIFVTRELGQGNKQLALDNAKRLWGFHIVLAFVLGLSLFSLSFAIPYADFLAGGYEKLLINSLTDIEIEKAVDYFLTNLKYVMWPLAFYMPVWVWYLTRSRCISGGGRTNLIASIIITNSIVQTAWISLIAWVIVPNNNISFVSAYALFFASDAIKIIVYEILFHKISWATNITLETKKSIQEPE